MLEYSILNLYFWGVRSVIDQRQISELALK